MKNYSSNRAQKGKTAYRTPSRWIKNRPEGLKRNFSNLKSPNIFSKYKNN